MLRTGGAEDRVSLVRWKIRIVKRIDSQCVLLCALVTELVYVLVLEAKFW
jgi:hypothetical protein